MGCTLAHPQLEARHKPPQRNIGILAAALYELRDFAPAFVPAGEVPAHVVATCPVCVGEAGSLGALRGEAVDIPQRLSWHCSLHNSNADKRKRLGSDAQPSLSSAPGSEEARKP